MVNGGHRPIGISNRIILTRMVEQVDTLDLGSNAARRGGSIPSSGIKLPINVITHIGETA